MLARTGGHVKKSGKKSAGKAAKKPVRKPAKKPASKAKKPAPKAKKPAPKRDKALPEGSSWVIPYLTVKDARAAMDFYKKAFGMKERMAMPDADGDVVHGELTHEGHAIMLGPEAPEHGARGPASLGGTPVTIMIYVRNVDSFHARAVAAGARSEMEPEDQFWGDRTCVLVDPEGHKWFCAQHVEDVSYESMAQAIEAMEDDEEPGPSP
jgi:PhnB protein